MKITFIGILIMFSCFFGTETHGQAGTLIDHNWMEVESYGLPFRVIRGSALVNPAEYLTRTSITDSLITLKHFKPFRMYIGRNCDYSIRYRINSDTLYLFNRVRSGYTYVSNSDFEWCAYTKMPPDQPKPELTFDSLDFHQAFSDQLLYIRIRPMGFLTINYSFRYGKNREAQPGYHSYTLSEEHWAELQKELEDAIYPHLGESKMCEWSKRTPRDWSEGDYWGALIVKIYNKGQITYVKTSQIKQPILYELTDNIRRNGNQKWGQAYPSDLYGKHDSVGRVYYYCTDTTGQYVLRGTVTETIQIIDEWFHSAFCTDSAWYLLATKKAPIQKRELEIYRGNGWNQIPQMLKVHGIEAITAKSIIEPSRTNVIYPQKPCYGYTDYNEWTFSEKEIRQWKRKNPNLQKLADWFKEASSKR